MPDSGGPRQAFFDLWSRFYDLPPVQRAIYHPVHDAVMDELRRPPVPGRVVDVGCGTGILTARLRGELSADLVAGCDFSYGMLEQARQRTSKVAWIHGDALALPLGDGTVDAIVSTEAFHWFPDQDAALREFHRVLAPDGRLLVGLVNPRLESASRAVQLASRAVGQPASWPTRAELQARLEAAGFRLERQRRVFRVAGVLIPTFVTVARR